MMLFKTAALMLLVSVASLVHAENWYEGGTLHGADLGAWYSAPETNKMATAADFAASAKLPKSMADLELWAVRISSCVDEVAGDRSFHAQKVSTIGAGCILLLVEDKYD